MKVLAGYIFFGLLLFPAWIVETAETKERFLWAGFLVIIGFLMWTMIAAMSLDPALKAAPVRPTFIQQRPRLRLGLGLTALLIFAIAVLLGSALTHVEPDDGLVAAIASAIASLGEYAFPVVRHYATNLNPPVTAATLLKLQAVVSVFMFGALGLSLIMLLISFLATNEDLVAANKQSPTGMGGGNMLIGLAIALLFAVPPLFGGLGEFSQGPYGKGCAIRANCYARGDDLLLIGAAMIKSLAVFFGLITLTVTIRNYIAFMQTSKGARR